MPTNITILVASYTPRANSVWENLLIHFLDCSDTRSGVLDLNSYTRTTNPTHRRKSQ